MLESGIPAFLITVLTYCAVTQVVLVVAMSPMRLAATSELVEKLENLSNQLVWDQDTITTYAKVLPAVKQAKSQLDWAVNTKPESIPQASKFADALHRLSIEAKYLYDLNSIPGHVPSNLDWDWLLKCSIAEWKYTIDHIIDNLHEPWTAKPGKYVGTLSPGVNASSAAGTRFQDREDGPVLVVLPTGSYKSGSSDDVLESWDIPRDFWAAEQPIREVRINKPLAFGETEVTSAEFQAFIDETGYPMRGGARWWDPADSVATTFNPDLNYRNPGFPQGEDHPVLCIRRQEAEAYTDWLSETTGKKYRLPNEDEWEWAARGGATTIFFWGDDMLLVEQYANTYDQLSFSVNNFQWNYTQVNDGFAYTAPVKSFKPNGFGLYDVTGNAREYVADDWVRDLSDAANDGSKHTSKVPFRSIRGGAWNYAPKSLRLNYRDGYSSSELATNMFGIRVVRELDPS